MKNAANKFLTLIKVLAGLLILVLGCKLVMAIVVPMMAAMTLFNLILWGAMGLGVLAVVGFVGIKLLGKGKRKK